MKTDNFSIRKERLFGWKLIRVPGYIGPGLDHARLL